MDNHQLAIRLCSKTTVCSTWAKKSQFSYINYVKKLMVRISEEPTKSSLIHKW